MKVIQNVSYADVARLLKNNNIVAIYQGNDEGGQRALGNRSILFNPSVNEISKLVNLRKLREWYRPVAGTILLEDFEGWFLTKSLKESPFMTHAVDVRPEKSGSIPAIVHKNITCRIQTVTQEQNFHYYNLIKEFKKLTGIPVIGNTSVNLGGYPIAHTLKDALHVIQNSMFEYLYLPEKQTLIYSKNER